MNMQLALNFPRSRNSDPETSKAAGKNARTQKAIQERIAIYEAVCKAPSGLTAREMAKATGIDYIEVQRRKSEIPGIQITDQVRDGCAVWRAV
jgi:DNA invertase Pin-like site-specific DNA recombinase